MTNFLPLENANVLILGGTGSLGQRLFARILAGDVGVPTSITVFSRDEAKQHYMRLRFLQQADATDDVIYRDSMRNVHFTIGNVRDLADVRRASDRADVIFHAAALKQVPTCEYFAAAAVDTNIHGALNIVQSLREGKGRCKTVVGISTDKACKPVNLMGMTKAIQERILAEANLQVPGTRFVNVRYGNVMASRGSAIPFFIQQARAGRPIPITDERMTRFLMTLNQSVDLIFNAVRFAAAGETYLPVVPCARITDMARAIAEREDYPLTVTGIRPGEKIHEILVSEEEFSRTIRRGENLVILPILPELRQEAPSDGPLPFDGEFSSGQNMLDYPTVSELLRYNKLTLSSATVGEELYT